MKHQALFSLKDTNNKVKVSSAAILFGALRVKLTSGKNVFPVYSSIHSQNSIWYL